jgi:uncharacterized protein YllA (UPF0747 family)
LKPEEVSRIDAPLSPNVLVRPAVQDTIFPTVAFIAGPAEISYLAQAGAVYQALGKDITPFFPRISATVVESRVAKAQKKYDIQFTDVLHGKEFIKRRAFGTSESAGAFADAKKSIEAAIESLRHPVNAVDPTLSGAIDTAKQKMLYQVEGLETKFVNAETRRNEVMDRQLDLLVNSLFPEKKLQERQLNVSTWLARYGFGFLKRLEELVSLDSTQHQIIEI